MSTCRRARSLPGSHRPPTPSLQSSPISLAARSLGPPASATTRAMALRSRCALSSPSAAQARDQMRRPVRDLDSQAQQLIPTAFYPASSSDSIPFYLPRPPRRPRPWDRDRSRRPSHRRSRPRWPCCHARPRPRPRPRRAHAPRPRAAAWARCASAV
jgi:hypothetical protein